MTKDSVLSILAKNEGYVSGETISSSLGISRAAVNLAVKALREEGCVIESSTRKGYRLTWSPDRLTAGDLGAFLPFDRMDRVLCLDTVASTNRTLGDLAWDGAPAGQAVVANEQTRGRGRLGRDFISPRDQGIYLSYLLRPQTPAADAASITAWTAVAVGRAVESVTGICPDVKWVNDLQIAGRKLCGILTEMAYETESGRIRSIIIGIGINVNENPEDFPEELRGVATSLRIAAGRTFRRAELAAAVIRELDRLAADWPDERAAYLDAYRAACITTGREVIVHATDGDRPGFAEAVGEDFSLRVRYPDGHCEDIRSGEVSVRSL